MKRCWRCETDKPLTEYVRDSSRGDGHAAQCKPCSAAQQRAWYEKNRERLALKHKATYVAKRQPKTPAQRKAERDASLAAYRAANRGRYKVWVAEWAKRNRAKCAAACREYQSKKRNAVPAWANKKAIEQVYAKAAFSTEVLGFACHVDHIVPIKSRIVCGLHVEHNLRVVPAAVNIGKGNRHWPDMPAST